MSFCFGGTITPIARVLEFGKGNLQSRQSIRLFLPSSELGPPTTQQQTSVSPPPLVPGGGGTHSLGVEGVGESQLDEGSDTEVFCRYTRKYCVGQPFFLELKSDPCDTIIV
jgi:hypothetical protein